ncbi:MAG: RsmB/NOP family class I SAM-dependent RNA methyltransferase [Treponema sp.]
MKMQKLSGEEQFEKYYSELFSTRWNALKQSLFGEPIYIEYSAGGKENYFLDPGSVLASQTLPLENAKNILDMCAAPGGKTLVIANNMEEDAHLDSNERSPQRKQRLDHVIENCLAEDVCQRIRTSCSDSATWCTRQSECYDAILLDAPCSSERHVLTDPKYLAMWTPNRIKSLAMEQWALLSSGWRLLKPNGYLLYATCALSPKENDNVVERLFTKFKDAEALNEAQIKKLQTEENLSKKIECSISPERTKYGFHVLPDVCKGAGPLYYSLLHKCYDL